MYVPQPFAVNDLPTLHGFMRRYSFATLVTQHGSAPFASHVQVVLDDVSGAQGKLIGHLARGNPQCEDFVSGAEVLAIFHGPHAYVSPVWYEPNPMVVPTWNYMAVHAYGRARMLSGEALERALMRQVDGNEQEQEARWRLEITQPMRERLLPGIMGFEIELSRIEGKFKLSQNRSEQDRRNVADQLVRTPLGKEVAEQMLMDLERK